MVRYAADGAVPVLDEDEFLLHLETLGYPEHVVDAARATVAWLVPALEQRREPFDHVGREWLARI